MGSVRTDGYDFNLFYFPNASNVSVDVQTLEHLGHIKCVTSVSFCMYAPDIKNKSLPRIYRDLKGALFYSAYF